MAWWVDQPICRYRRCLHILDQLVGDGTMATKRLDVAKCTDAVSAVYVSVEARLFLEYD